jgi:hypothetical protein
MAIFDGLYLYEVVLLVCGVLMFFALLAGLLWMIFSNRNYKGLLIFFVLPIAMIGFPSITSIQLKDGAIEIEKQTTALQGNPQNTQARATLQAQVAKIEARPFKDPAIMSTLARAQFALGDENKAESNLNTALAASPNAAGAAELKNKIELTKNLKAQVAAVEAQPGDVKSRDELRSTYMKLNQLPLANPKAIAMLSRAQAVLEKKAAAQ